MEKAIKILSIIVLVLCLLFIASILFYMKAKSTLAIVCYGVSGFCFLGTGTALLVIKDKIKKQNED